MEDEAAAIAEEAFEAGYKEGRIDGAALWKPRYEDMAERAIRAEKRPSVTLLVLGVIGAFAAGAGAGFLFGTVR
ncbi:MAG: hypothetical protein LBI86_09735 [Treponema sp.]|nr:hypothetical protein [Treponema sp.]